MMNKFYTGEQLKDENFNGIYFDGDDFYIDYPEMMVGAPTGPEYEKMFKRLNELCETIRRLPDGEKEPVREEMEQLVREIEDKASEDNDYWDEIAWEVNTELIYQQLN